MVLIIKITKVDDSYDSKNIDVMVSSSMDAAKELVLKEINKEFDENWASLDKAAEILAEDLTDADWDEVARTFMWSDNGKGETFIIGKLNEREVNTKFQYFGLV